MGLNVRAIVEKARDEHRPSSTKYVEFDIFIKINFICSAYRFHLEHAISIKTVLAST